MEDEETAAVFFLLLFSIRKKKPIMNDIYSSDMIS